MAQRAARQAPGRAVAVLILGVASLISCFPLPGIAAILLAPGARRQIADSGGALAGGQLIRVGVACGWASLILAAAILVLFVGFVVLRS
jgi:hypothetical protein